MTTTTLTAEYTVNTTEVTATTDTMTLTDLEALTFEELTALPYETIKQFKLADLTTITGSKAVALSLLLPDETDLVHSLKELALQALYAETCDGTNLYPLYEALGNVDGADKLLNQLKRKKRIK